MGISQRQRHHCEMLIGGLLSLGLGLKLSLGLMWHWLAKAQFVLLLGELVHFLEFSVGQLC